MTWLRRLPLRLMLAGLAGALLLSGCALNEASTTQSGVGEITKVMPELAAKNTSAKPSSSSGAAPVIDQIAQKPGAVKVAVLLPLSGKKKTAELGKTLKQAGELAMFDFDNPNVVFLPKDTKGTPQGAREAANAAVRARASLILGPLFSSSVSAAAPVAKAAQIPMISFSNDRKAAGDGVYLLSFMAGRDVERIVSYTIAQGKRRFAALIPKSNYGRIVQVAFEQAVSRHGGEIIAMETFPLDANGMLKPVKKISQLAQTKDGAVPQIDALFIPAGRKIIPTLSPILPYFDIDTKAVQVIGTGVWNYDGIGREKPLHNAWFPSPDPKGWREFAKRYSATYGASPPRLASLSYDAVSLAVALSRNGGRYSSADLTRASGFAGVDGLFRLRRDGTSDRGLAILGVQKFGFRVVDPAPSTFTRAQY